MKASVQAIKSTMAGLAGSMLLFSYRMYGSLFLKKKMYDEISSQVPARREIILVKGQHKVFACILN